MTYLLKMNLSIVLKGIVPLFIFFNCVSISAQDKKSFNGVDMEKNMEMRRYYAWVASYASQKQFDSSNHYAKRAMDLAKALKNDEMLGYAKVNNALNFYLQRKIDEAKSLLVENITSTDLHDTIKIRSHVLLGDIHQYEKDYLRGVAENIAAEKLLRKNEVFRKWDSITLSRVYINIGNLHKEIKEYDIAHSYYKNALDYNVDKGMDSYMLYHRSELYEEEDKIYDAIAFTKKAITIVTKERSELFLPTYYLALSKYYTKLEKGDSAVYYGKKGIEDNSYCQLDLLHNAVGNGYFSKGNYNSALRYYKSALLESTSPAFDTTVHRNLSKTYERLQDYKNALVHNTHYLALKDSLDELKVRQEIFDITEKYESNKKQLEIEKLNLENAENELVIKEQRSQLTIVFIALFGLLLLLSTIYYFFLKQKKQRHLLFLKNLELAKELKQKDNAPVKMIQKSEPSSMHDEQREKIHRAIEKLIESEFYLNPDMTLSLMAKHIETNTTYLSKVINEDYEKSFATFLNELRLAYTLKNLESHPKFRRLTIDHIAEKSGFASSSTFYNAFKKYTGLTPSYYIKKRVTQFG